MLNNNKKGGWKAQINEGSLQPPWCLQNMILQNIIPYENQKKKSFYTGVPCQGSWLEQEEEPDTNKKIQMAAPFSIAKVIMGHASGLN